MKTPKTLAVIALSMMVSMCSGHIGGSHISLQDIEPQVYCGRTLSRALGLLCYGVPLADKRAVGSSMYNSILSQFYKEQIPNQDTQSGWPWLTPHRARTMSVPSREKRYVVNECCEKPCSINELMSYC